MKSWILIYQDEGVSLQSVDELKRAFHRWVHDRHYLIKTVNSDFLKEAAWEKNTALLVIPGGRARLYYKMLGDLGNKKIKQFVEAGGRYLGLCAGAYYGASVTEFEMGNDEMQVRDEGPFYFYPGRAVGPAYGFGKFKYQSEDGAEIARIQTADQVEFRCYYNGGCYFTDADQAEKVSENVTVFSRYANIEGQPAAMVECNVGNGKAFLSGVHFEYTADAEKIKNNDMKQLLRETQVKRDQLGRKILMTLGIAL